MPRRIDLSNKKFNKLTVIEQAPHFNGRIRWLCKCDCGNTTNVNTYDIKSGKTKTCGCAVGGKETHGLSKIPEYKIWASIIQRTTNPNDFSYPKYGGRGITVCDNWLKFENFIEDMGRRPNKNLSVERVNNDKGYFSDNCKWDTRKNQNRNKRSNRHVTINGITKLITDWLDCSPVHYSTYYRRRKRGLSERESLGI